MGAYSYVRTAATAAGVVNGIFDLVESQLTLHAAWDRVDVITSSTSTCSVWRCSATLNAAGKAFYLLLYKIGTVDVYVTLAENYNTTTKAANRVIPLVDSANATPPGVDGSFMPEAEHPVFSGTAVNSVFGRISITARTGTFANDIWVLVNNSTVTVWGNSGGSSTYQLMTHFGLFESLLVSDPFPLGMSTNGGTSTPTNTSGVTRFPFVSAVQVGNWALNGPWISQRWTQTSGVLNGAGDRLHNQRPVASRIPVLHAGAADSHGRLRGLFRSLLSVAQIDGSTMMGDTIVINNEQYAAIGPLAGGFLYLANISEP